jgi:uncharacterized protein YcnI
MKTTVVRLAAAAGTAAAAVLLSTAPAWAHVGTSADEVAAGDTIALGLTIGHGCEDSPTTAVSIQIPDGVNNAQPFAHAGWTASSETEALVPPVTDAHGEELTERVAVITFTAEDGNALPHDVRDTFTVNFAAPDTPGETLHFKTIQTCEAGENAWIDEWDGEGEEPESPAPSILVTEAAAEGGHDEETTDTTEAEEAEDVTDTTEATADDSSTSDDDGNGLAVAGVVLGGLGLATGGVALSRTRTSS